MLLSTPMCRLMLVLQTPGYAAFTAMWSSFHSRASCRTVSMMARQRKRVRLIHDWLISLLYSMIRGIKDYHSGTMWLSFHSRASCITVSMLAKQWKRVNEVDWLIKNLIVQYDTPHSPLCDSFTTVGQAVVLSACWLSSGKECEGDQLIKKPMYCAQNIVRHSIHDDRLLLARYGS